MAHPKWPAWPRWNNDRISRPTAAIAEGISRAACKLCRVRTLPEDTKQAIEHYGECAYQDDHAMVQYSQTT